MSIPLKGHCGRQNNAPCPRCSCPNSWNLWISYVTWKGGIKIAQRLKFANQMTLYKKIVLGYPGGSNGTTRSFKVEKGGEEEVIVRDLKILGCWLWRERKRLQAKKCCDHQKLEKADSPLDPPALLTPWFWPSNTHFFFLFFFN